MAPMYHKQWIHAMKIQMQVKWIKISHTRMECIHAVSTVFYKDLNIFATSDRSFRLNFYKCTYQTNSDKLLSLRIWVFHF